MNELAADGVPVAVTCRVLKLARQPYYRWRANPVTDAERGKAYRANALFDAHRDDRSSATVTWSRRPAKPVSPWLSAPPGGSAHNIGCGVCSARSAARTARPRHRCTTILLSATSLPMHQISCGSAISLSIRAREGKLYICAIKDVFSNRIVGYCMDSRMKSRLATTALHNAVARRGEVAGCVLHTDRGSQFRSRKFVHALGRREMVGSMGRVGLPATTPPWRASSVCCKRTFWIATTGIPERN